ncbi:MAG: hypothetical protein PHW73_03905 [Atribacterota bacterium]|nr:hypothetical protein [Atribacterota bacterium]
MRTEIGEYIVGAYLKIIKECDFVDYNVRPRGGKLEGLNELDVVGINFKSNSAYLCEATTHTTGLLIKDYETTINTISKKYKRQREYAEKYLKNFSKHYFMFWSPFVSDRIMKNLEKNKGLELIINEKYALCIKELKEKALKMTNDTGNPFFRMLQITEKVNKKCG